MNSINNYIDHTNLKQDAIESDITTLCKEAIQHGFFSVCVNPFYVPLAAINLKEHKPKVGTVIGFPLGADSGEMKYAETRFMIHQGAEEIDMVLNIGALKDRSFEVIRKEINKVVEASDGNCVKVIIETCLLNNEEIKIACKIAKDAGATFVKTSTGFSSGGATIEDVKLMRKTVGADMGVKASGGIKSLEHIELLIDAGANRIGTSNAVEILK